MLDNQTQIVMNISTSEPVELLDFVGMFSSLASQYERTIGASNSDLDADARIYVSEIRPGSIEAVLIPTLGVIITHMDQLQIIEQFIRTYGTRLMVYFGAGGRDPEANRSDLQDLLNGVAAIANDPNGNATIEAVSFEDGNRNVRASIQFDTKQARTALKEIEAHRRELERVDQADRERVLMYFQRSDRGDATVGKRSGERVVIETISGQDHPLIYASQLAEDRIKDEIRNSDGNIYHKGFVVDVNIQTRSGKVVAYAVTDVHQIIDMDADD